MIVTRREALSTLGVSAIALAVPGREIIAAEGGQAAAPVGPYVLAPLPYPVGALEPHIDALTMQIHHDRHHQAYVNNLNAAIASAGEAGKTPLDDLLKNLAAVPEAVRVAVRNNGGGHVNHRQFWTLLAPNAGGPPSGAIADAIKGTFGSFDAFKDQFAKAAMGRFGSGWAWLSDDRGTLVVHSTPNQDTPSMEGKRAVFGLDVWEHAYYLKYQNRRADYVGAFWNVINWAEINKRLAG
ncbi:MAG: superoxide dismutase [Acidobacteria bacterium]|nr:superoxide dismutase [Acidobacteriota bacterium]